MHSTATPKHRLTGMHSGAHQGLRMRTPPPRRTVSGQLAQLTVIWTEKRVYSGR